ncbi:hypothetical protein KBY83_05835 [Cyanobium sp. WKJ7-Wakatipu]|nr:hypothetical protein [Cyanobium sp. WKJ7-Wakatipu]
MKTLPSSRKPGGEDESLIASRAAIQAADSAVARFSPSAFQSPAAATNRTGRDQGETWRGTQPLGGKSSSVGSLGL